MKASLQTSARTLICRWSFSISPWTHSRFESSEISFLIFVWWQRSRSESNANFESCCIT
jgi:hypothetical protein